MQLQDAAAELAKRDASVVAIVVDDGPTNAKLAKRLGVGFPILSDADLSATKAYGIEDAGKDIALPATFVIDRSGKLRWLYVGDNPRDRPIVSSILDALDKAG